MASVKKKKVVKKKRNSVSISPQPTLGNYEQEPVLNRDLRPIYNDLQELRTLTYDGQSKIHNLIEKLSKIEGQLDIIVKFAGK